MTETNDRNRAAVYRCPSAVRKYTNHRQAGGYITPAAVPTM